MTVTQTLSSMPPSDAILSIDVAVVELLGLKAAQSCAADLKKEANAAAIAVRAVPRTSASDNVPQRRRRAVDGTSATVAFLLEDTTYLAPGWAAALYDAFSDPHVAAVCGPVTVAPGLAPRYRALGRLEYGRFDGTGSQDHLPGNAFAVRLTDLQQILAPGEGIIEHDLERRLVMRGRKVRSIAALTSIYAQPDPHGARLSTRFGHGRLYGADRGGNRALGVLRALLATPVLSMRGFHTARRAGPARQWLPEMPWIVVMAGSWALGELTGQIAGKGNSDGSWN